MGQTLTRPKVIAIGIPLLLGQIVGLLQGKDSFTWFKILKKPAWCPPVPLFPIAWTTLYALMGYASYLVYQHGGFEAQKGVLTLYGVQLLLNLAWPLLFFKAKKIKLAQAENLVMLGTVIATTKKFYEVDVTAGRLMIPYIAWLLLANALNFYIAKQNLSADQDPRLEDLYHSDDKRNPGEQGQGIKPATASLRVEHSQIGRNRGKLQVFGQMSRNHQFGAQIQQRRAVMAKPSPASGQCHSVIQRQMQFA